MNRENTDPILQSEMEENNLTRSAIKTESVREIATRYDVIKEEIGKYVIGNQELIRLILIGLLSGGHILIEGVPGTAKTTLAKIFAALSDLTFTGFSVP